MTVVIAVGSVRAGAQQDRTPRVDTATRTLDSLRASVRGSTTTAVGRAQAALQLAEALRTGGRATPEVLAAYEQAAALGAAAPDSSVLSRARYVVGLMYWSQNQYDSALANLEQARTVRSRMKDRAGLGQVLNSIGASYYQMGIYEQALDAYLQSLDIRSADADTAGMARTLTNIGKTYHDWRLYDRARRTLEEAAVLAARVDSGAVLGYTRNSQSMLAIDQREFAAARRFLDQSIAAYQRRGAVTTSDSLSGWSLNTAAAGLLRIREGKPREGALILDSLLAAGRRRGSVRGQARANLYLGEAHRALGNLPEARAAFTRALNFARSAEQRILALDALQQLAEIEETSGQSAAALRYLHDHVALRDSLFNQTTAQRIAAMEARAQSDREQREITRLRDNERVQRAVIAKQRIVVTLVSLVLLLTAALLGFLVYFNRTLTARSAAVTEANAELRRAMAEVRTLTGLIPICASCKKVRDDQGYWNSVESYISRRSEATFSHGICRSCALELYGPDLVREAQLHLDAAVDETDRPTEP